MFSLSNNTFNPEQSPEGRNKVSSAVEIKLDRQFRISRSLYLFDINPDYTDMVQRQIVNQAAQSAGYDEPVIEAPATILQELDPSIQQKIAVNHDADYYRQQLMNIHNN